MPTNKKTPRGVRADLAAPSSAKPKRPAISRHTHTSETRPISELRAHPLASTVPALTDELYTALKNNIATQGVEVPVEITKDGVVLDGHARLRAACELGIATVEVRVLAPANELEHILQRALLRKHLSAGQRTALAVKLLPFEQLRVQAAKRQRGNLRQNAERAMLPARGERSRDLVAALSGTGERTVQDVITVFDNDPALFERVARGQVSASTAARQVRRAARDAAIPPPPPLPEGPYPLILLDPPWQMGSPDSPYAPEQHYPTLPLEEIKALQLPAADDAVLFLWAVNSLLPQAFAVVEAWGFEYHSEFVWIKPSIGPGVWLRQRHEHLRIATKGRIAPPDPEDRCDSVIEAPRGRHSEKPDEAYERIERMYPHLPKLEMFARGIPRPGWQIWGNQAQATTPEAER